MDARALEKAAEEGDVSVLRMLLQHDPNLLFQLPCAAFPLHTAAMRGHHDFVKEILTHVPDLASRRDKLGSFPLHLAAANGHGKVVDQLLTIVGNDLCRLLDKDGMMAIHVAAVRGRVQILEKLLLAAAADDQSLFSHDHVEDWVTENGETVLHLGVRAHQLNVVKFLAQQPCFDSVLLNHGDIYGHTALHLAVAGKNLPMVKFLLSKAGIEVNAETSQNEDTALDMLEQGPYQEEEDSEVRNIILQAGGTGKNLLGRPVVHSEQINFNGARDHGISIPPSPGNLIKTNESSNENEKQQVQEWFKDTRNAVIIVATLIATITFQVAVNPPGGYFDKNECVIRSNYDNQKANCSDDEFLLLGTAIVGNTEGFNSSMLCDLVAFSSSMTVILLLLTRYPQRYHFMMLILIKLMQLSIFATALTFLLMVRAIIPPRNRSIALMTTFALAIWNVIIVELILWWAVGNILHKFGVRLRFRVVVCLIISGFVLWAMIKYIYVFLFLELLYSTPHTDFDTAGV